MHPPSSWTRGVPSPRVVTADTPRRSRLHFEGFRASKRMGFLFDMTSARARAVSSAWSRIPIEERKGRTMWVPAASFCCQTRTRRTVIDSPH